MKFSELQLNVNVLEALDAMRFDECTPIQEQAIPIILEGKDLIAVAQTGTGKTAAFLLPILNKLSEGGHPEDAINCVIMSPTRELAQQIDQQMEGFSYFMPASSVAVYGGNDGIRFEQEKKGLTLGAEVVIATPGRLISHLSLGYVDLSKVSFFILDEADRMLDMGFSDAIDDVIRFAPASRQTLLFSATWPEAIAAISGRVQRDPLAIEIDSTDALPPIEQQFYETSSKGKIPLLQRLLSLHQPSSCVVFCNTKKDCQAVCDALNEVGQSALSLHGDLEQRDRDQTLVRFANGSARVLVATDVAARGLDIKSLELVVNFELAWDPEVHVHRIGRTARAGNSGLAISFCAPEEAQRANIISDMLQIKLNWQTPPANSSIVPLEAEMATLCIDGGKKAKMRPGDVLGALTGDIGLDGADIGKIAVHPAHVYVAVRQAVAHKAWKQLQGGKIKGKTCRVRLLK